MSQRQCTVCMGHDVSTFLEIPRVPVLCNILWPTQAAAQQVKRVQVPLAFCRTCGHIFNPDFELAALDYSEVYENSLHFSAHFQHYADTLAADLVSRHNLRGKHIVEIGSGKGDFLEMLCELGDNSGVGFDPSYIPGETERTRTQQITFVQDFYSEQYAHVETDFICCRHTLEHIPDPRGFLQMLRRVIGDRTDIVVFFEVPNALHTVQNLAIWDIIYEHCGYFTPYSLAYLFWEAGFTVTGVEETFSGQFLTIEAIPASAPAAFPSLDLLSPAQIAADIGVFAERYAAKVADSHARIATMATNGESGVIWGAGSKGITFLNILDPGETITHAVDINPRKQGKFITGTGQPIVGPEALRAIGPNVVFVMNAVYMDEIRQIAEEMGLCSRFETL